MTASAVLQHVPTRFDPDQLLKARLDAGLTLRDVAAVTGWNHGTVNRYERGVIDPTAGVLAVLADLYRVAPGKLFTTAG